MKKLLPLLFLLLPVGCEVLEEDISHDRVPVVAPADKVSVAAGTVDFRWAAVEYATGYEFTAVSPSFAAAGRVVADTVIRAAVSAAGCRSPSGSTNGALQGLTAVIRPPGRYVR